MSEEEKKFIFKLCLLFACVPIGWVAYSWLEARAFNNVTGKNVSTLDAMFLDLRVQEPTK